MVDKKDLEGSGTLELKRVNDAGSYEHSFGILPNHTTYVNYFRSGLEGKSIDLRRDLSRIAVKGMRELQMKALTSTTGGAGTAGYAMVPVYVDPRIVDTTRKYTPLVELIPRVTNQGKTADFNKITAKGSAVVAGEDAALTEQTDTYDRASVSIKYLYSVGRVTGPAQAAFPSYMLQGFQSTGSGLPGSAFTPQSAPNAKQLEVILKARALRELEENLIINGDSSSDANEFDGLLKQQGTTNKVSLSSAISLDDLDSAVKEAFDDGGRPNLAVASSGAYKTILSLLNAKIGYMSPVKEVFWGFSTIVYRSMVGEIPIIPSMYMPEGSSGYGTVLLLDMDYIEMRVLQDMTYEDLAKTNDSQKFMLKIYEALVMKNPAFNAVIKE